MPWIIGEEVTLADQVGDETREEPVEGENLEGEFESVAGDDVIAAKLDGGGFETFFSLLLTEVLY